jgi:uncharacterized iron-regulated protein
MGVSHWTFLTLALGAALLGGCAAAPGAAPSATPPAGAAGELTPYPAAKPPQAGDIIHLPTGITMNFAQAMEMISAARVIYVGEMHSNFQAHEAQRRIVEDLERRFPGRVAIGMEMFREPQQPALDRWTRGELTEPEFLKESKWYDNWGSDFGHYRGILAFARDKRMDVIALNPSKEVQKQFAAAGTEPLPPEIAAKLPETDFTDPYQRALLQAIFKGHDAGSKVFDSFYRTQILWEETMAARIVDYLASPAGAGKKLVVIAGGFHVRYGLGIPRKALRRAALPYTIVLPTEISIPEELKAELTMDVEPPELPMLPGDFAWMVPYEDVAEKRVRLGVMMRAQTGAVIVEKVLPGSPAEEVGIRFGDQFVSIDGVPVTEQGDVVIAISAKKPGDRVQVKLLRDGAPVTVGPVLTVPPAPPKN